MGGEQLIVGWRRVQRGRLPIIMVLVGKGAQKVDLDEGADVDGLVPRCGCRSGAGAGAGK
jgi:hypothetical protein